MVAQNKGKDLHKVPKSKLKDIEYLTSIKFDGHYTQIEYDGQHVVFTTSGNKEFYLSQLADDILVSGLPPFHIECEFNFNCEGKLGDRGKSAVLTTYRTNFSKGIETSGAPFKDIFRVLDLVDQPHNPFWIRQQSLRALFDDWTKWFQVPTQVLMDIPQAQAYARACKEEGYEGCMLKDPNHKYKPGKRSNDIIKLKPRLTADLLCVGTKGGTGKYEGLIGSLLLRDKAGREVWAGSGLDDYQRAQPDLDYIGRVVEIEYERIDETYIQPIIKHFRDDKQPQDID